MQRTIVQSQRASEAYDAALRKYPQLEEVYLGVEWALSLDPLSGGYRISKSPPIYLMCVRSWVKSPDLEVLYKIDDDGNRVHILSLGLIKL